MLKFDLKKFKEGPVGNRHVHITLHVISMLHIHDWFMSFGCTNVCDYW